MGIEGTDGAQVYRNYGERTGVAGIRVSSQKNWNTAAVSNIDLRDNVLVNVRTNTNIDHTAIMLFTNFGSIRNVTFANTTIKNPITWGGGRMLNYVPTTATISGVSFGTTTITSSDGRVKKCFDKSSTGVTALQLTNNTLNAVACS